MTTDRFTPPPPLDGYAKKIPSLGRYNNAPSEANMGAVAKGIGIIGAVLFYGSLAYLSMHTDKQKEKEQKAHGYLNFDNTALDGKDKLTELSKQYYSLVNTGKAEDSMNKFIDFLYDELKKGKAEGEPLLKLTIPVAKNSSYEVSPMTVYIFDKNALRDLVQEVDRQRQIFENAPLPQHGR